MPRVPPPALTIGLARRPVLSPSLAVPAHRTPMGIAVVPPSSGGAPSAAWIEEPTLLGDRRTRGDRVTIALVRCAPPREDLERAAMSDFTPPPHAELSSWHAYWAGDERYMLRGQRADGGVEWYAVALVPDESSPTDAATDAAPHPARGTPATSTARTRAATARTALVGWRPLGRGNSARWTVAWRRQ
jgi:hypothetical protein